MSLRSRAARPSGWFVAIALILGGLVSSPSEASGVDSWDYSPRPGAGETILEVRPGLTLGPYSQIYVGRNPSSAWNRFRCIDIDADPCQVDLEDPPPLFNASLNLPLCESHPDQPCVEGFSTSVASGNRMDVEFLGYAPGFWTKAYPDLDLPAGAPLTLWGFTDPGGVTHNFALLSRLYYEFKNSRFVPAHLQITLLPYSLRDNPDSRDPSLERLVSASDSEQFVQEMRGVVNGQVFVSNGQEAVFEDFDLNLRHQVALRIPSDVGGWFVGQIDSLEVSQDSISDEMGRLTVSAKPAKVPVIQARIANADLPPLHFRQQASTNGFRFTYRPTVAYEWLDEIAPIIGDKVQYEATTWNLETVSPALGKCDANVEGIVGIVSTNSLAYSTEIPVYKNGVFRQEVAGLHYAPDGITPNVGNYQMMLQSELARCLYGFKNAPISASVSVLNDAGKEVVATTVVSEKDGWLTLSAAGFTFSKKEIQIKLSQSQIKTLTNFTSSSLSAKQKAEIRSVLAKSEGNSKFICTGIRYVSQPMSENVKVRARAKAACDYAKSLNPDLSYWYQTKTTNARSYNGKVMVVSKG